MRVRRPPKIGCRDLTSPEDQVVREYLVGTPEELETIDRKFVIIDDMKIAVFPYDGGYRAYENRCVHQGGPVCEGRILGRVEAVLEEDGNVLREVLSQTVQHLVCPWHGFEFDLGDGSAAGDRRLKLRTFDVIERDGQVFVVA